MRLKRKLFALLLLIAATSASLAQEVSVLQDSFSLKVITNSAVVLEDAAHQLTIDQVVNDKTLKFEQLTNDNLDFTASSYWMKFKLSTASSSVQTVYLNTARPVTNKVILYEVADGKAISEYKSGDDFPFSIKEIPHRHNLFKLHLIPGNVHEFVIMAESDGELLTVPIVLMDQDALNDRNYNEQWMLGVYYGILLFVVLIYYFFYVVLRQRTFLYYVFYVVSLIALQFSLDGFTFQYVFPNSSYFANHLVLLSAALSSIFVVLYAKSFLKSKERIPKLNKVFNGLLIFTAFILLLSLIPGITYRLTFPTINVSVMLTTLLIPVAIIVSERKGHPVDRFFSIAFVILVVSAVLFILRNLSVLPSNMFTEHVLKIGSALEVIFLSFSMANRYRELQKEKELAQAETLKQLEEKNRLQDGINERLEREVKERTAEISEQKEQLAEQNKDILDSIRYAQRLQNAILPSDSTVKEIIPESFILYKPRDIVSGDFYWVAEVTTSDSNKKVALFVAADCTGHGVPGAFVSILGANLLKLSQKTENVNTPGQALDFLSNGVNSSLNQRQDERTVRDGMDIAICGLDREEMKLFFAGAKNPVYIIRSGNFSEDEVGTHKRSKVYREIITSDSVLMEYKGDKRPVGAYEGASEPFADHTIDVQEGDTIYVFSDGYQDQFGGEKGHKFMTKRFKELLLSIHTKPLEEQKLILDQTIQEWMDTKNSNGKPHRQLDDILVMGVRV